jgi:thymidylate synthase
MLTYENFTDAYVDLCKLIRDNFDFESSPRGLKIKEKLGVQFRIKNPRDRLPYVKARNFSLSYFVAESIWYMSGNNSTDWISRYAPFWKNISDDGRTANSAYGARIFKSHPRIADGEIIQWRYVKEELKRDPDSRRAVIHIRTPDDSLYAVKDVPCTLSLQFFIRDSKLHLHVTMRSSDIILGLPYDVPAFTLMQEVLANELGVELGEYVHTSNSLHCYERDFSVLNEISSSIEPAGFTKNPMCRLPANFPTMALVQAERDIFRTDVDSLKSGQIIDQISDEIFFEDEEAKSFVLDWSRILASSRLRKFKDYARSKEEIDQTTFFGYHYFDR